MIKKKVINTQKKENHPEWFTKPISQENIDKIAEQKERGQKQLCMGNVLPVESLSDFKGLGSTKKKLEELGVVFGELVKDDPLFQYAVWPDKWSIEPMDHVHWNTLQTDKGKIIIKIFYNASFNDRRAHMVY